MNESNALHTRNFMCITLNSILLDEKERRAEKQFIQHGSQRHNFGALVTLIFAFVLNFKKISRTNFIGFVL